MSINTSKIIQTKKKAIANLKRVTKEEKDTMRAKGRISDYFGLVKVGRPKKNLWIQELKTTVAIPEDLQKCV